MIEQIASLTRRFHPRGTYRLLRLLYSPDRSERGYETIFTRKDGTKMHIDTSSHLEWTVFFFGAYEDWAEGVISKLPDEAVVVDVGANIGVHTLSFAKKCKKVYAFEPFDKPRNRLEENIKLNGFQNVVLSPIALSNYSGKASLFTNPKSDKNSGKKSATIAFPDPRLKERYKVEVSQLDRVIDEKIDFIKIDTDGSDEAVILGAENLIKKWHPRIFAEWRNAAQILQSWGYNVIEKGADGFLCTYRAQVNQS